MRKKRIHGRVQSMCAVWETLGECLADASLLLSLAAGPLGDGHEIWPQGHAQMLEEKSRQELGPSCLPVLAT